MSRENDALIRQDVSYEIESRLSGALRFSPQSAELAALLTEDPLPEVRMAAARRCADLHSLAKAWKREPDAQVRVALAAALVNVLAGAHDSEALSLLESEHFTDAIRSEVARRARHPSCRHLAITSIRDDAYLVDLARSADDPAIRKAAGDHVGARRLKRLDASTPEIVTSDKDPVADRIALYVPRVLQQHLATNETGQSWTDEGTAVFVDISGFTQLSEQLARRGREGAEQITDIIGTSFDRLLESAYDNGGSLLKFGGDALLLWFAGEGHVVHACRAAILMRNVLNDVGRIELPGVSVTLRISQGVHSGRFEFFAVGSSHIELLPVGPAWSRLVDNEHDADANEIVISEDAASLLPADCVGETKGAGRLLAHMPAGFVGKTPLARRPQLPLATLSRCLATAVRGHVAEGGIASEHRPVTIAFLRFETTDALVRDVGGNAAAEALHRLVSIVEAAADRRGVALLSSDVDRDGGKLILTAGAPRVTGDDEERMLLALREIIAADLPLPVRIGVHRGAVFAGDIGPVYRRTYTVMGDAVNVAARLMAKAEPGRIYATADVLDRSDTLFELTELAPLTVKGKTQPLRAWSVGRGIGSRTRNLSLERLPLIGRSAELGLVRKALASARSGSGRLVHVIGDAGVGKTRLLEATRDAAVGFRKLHAVCEAYTSSTPYVDWRELLRELLEIGRDEPDQRVLQRVRDVVVANAPDLLPWLPLLAAVFGADVEMTPEVEMLAEQNRRAKLHETVARFLEAVLPGPAVIEFENAHHMNEASAELLDYIAGRLDGHKWMFGVARRRTPGGFSAPESPQVLGIELRPLTQGDSLRMAQIASEQTPLPAHVLDVVAQRSGGNPQFLRDLLRSAVESGGVAGLPDSAEAAAMARIDALAPEDRATIRHASVFGLTFHPRMLAWFSEDDRTAPPQGETWERLRDFFEDDGEGYLRFRQSLLRDAAYEGLPFKHRRRLHATVAVHLEEEADDPDDLAGILSLHYLSAAENKPAFRYSTVAAKRAEAVYAYVEAAKLYKRALDAARSLTDIDGRQLVDVHEALGDALDRAGEFRKATEAYTTAEQLPAVTPLQRAGLLFKRSKVEEVLGDCAESLRWADRAREALVGLDSVDAARQRAHLSGWQASVLMKQGDTDAAVEWARRAVEEAEAVDDPNALGAAYFVKGWVATALGEGGTIDLWQQSLEAYRRAGNRARQAGLLSNLGVACQWEGRWDDALNHYERAYQESVKIGNVVDAELARTNLAEILADRGELTEAGKLCTESLPRWKALEYKYFLAACLTVLGRVAMRSGRLEDAVSRFNEAKAQFLQAGAEQDALAIDAHLAECKCLAGQVEEALALAEATLARATNGAVVKLAALLQRVRGYAQLQLGDTFAAREAFDASLAAARERRDWFEITLTLHALIDLDRLEGVEPASDIVCESRELLSKLKIRALPPTPTPTSAL